MYYTFSNGDVVDTLAKAEHVIVSAVPPTEAIGEVYVAGIQKSGSALRAASDLLCHGIYDTPYTQPGLHCYAKKLLGELDSESWHSMFGLFAKRVGVVHALYTGKLTAPAEERIATIGWNQLDLENGFPVQTNFLDLRTKEEIDQGLMPFDISRAWKHNFIDALLKGYTLKIRVLYKGKASDWRETYASVIINQWAMEDKEAAFQDRNDRIQNRTEYVNVHRPIERETWRKSQDRENGIAVAKPPANKETGELQIMVAVYGFKKKRVNMYDVPVGTYSIANAGRILNSRPYNWDPDEQDDRDNWLAIASKGLAVVLPK